MHIKAPTHSLDWNQKPTAFIWQLCCLLSDPFSRKVALNTPLRRATYSTVVCTFCACARCNKPRVVLHENRKWIAQKSAWKNKAHTVFRPSHTVARKWLRASTNGLPLRVLKILTNVRFLFNSLFSVGQQRVLSLTLGALPFHRNLEIWLSNFLKNAFKIGVVSAWHM